MNTTESVQGMDRTMFLMRLKLGILLHFLPLLAGSAESRQRALLRPESKHNGENVVPRLSLRRFVLFARRLLLFLKKLDHNKFMRIGPTTRMDLYVPNYPSAAFYSGCQKFLVFDDLPPCVTVLISLTSACRFSCEHCYQRFDRGHDVPIEHLLRVVRRLQEQGIAFFNLEGGEPFLVYERLRAVCAAIDSRSEVWVNSTGDGMTLERLHELKRLNLSAVMFSLHTAEPAKLNAFMHSDKAWDSLVRGVGLCHEAGVPVAFNTCLTREGFYNGEFEAIMDRAREFQACLVQLIKPKPAGAWLAPGASHFGPEDFQRVTDLVMQYNHDPHYADFPAISAQVLEEDRSRFGCTAGGVDRFYINAKGDVQACEFLNLSFGNILEEEFESIYRRMRAQFMPPGETWLCEACAPKIGEAFRAQKVPTLPLTGEASEQIRNGWDRGKPTGFYSEIQKLT